MQVPLAAFAKATLTVGTDAWRTLSASTQIEPQALTGTLTGRTTITRNAAHNTGGFLQTQLGLGDQLFFTYGARAEWNPDFGKDAQPNYAPRYGVAYTRENNTPFGGVTTKLRASYGRSTRPPSPDAKVARPASDPNLGLGFTIPEYGNYDYILANPDLGPEFQQGGEGGIELYFGTRSSLIVTRYNQTVDGLVNFTGIDSARSLAPNPSSYYESLDVDGYGYIHVYQNLNVGSIRNQGWELQGTVNMGRFATRGTYSWTKSRVIGITEKYRQLFTDAYYRQYQPGASFSYFPEHTWALGTTYDQSKTTISLTVTGNGRVRTFANEFMKRYLRATRLPDNQWRTLGDSDYPSFVDPYAMADLTGTRRVSSRVDATLEVRNLTNLYRNDADASFAIIGRQSKVGVRVRW
jgi:outer membrane receptor protein involved in Fe transport